VKQHENSPAHLENVIVGAGGGLQNVVLYISEGLSAADASATPSQEPAFDQKDCMYTPHVLAMDVNQKFKVTTSDQTTHNIHPSQCTRGKYSVEQIAAARSSGDRDELEDGEVAIPVKCNIHPWMHGYFVVVKGQYAVTDDKGSYTITGVPPGNYTVTAWQEEYGTQTAKVTVAAGKSGSGSLTSASEAGGSGLASRHRYLCRLRSIFFLPRSHCVIPRRHAGNGVRTLVVGDRILPFTTTK